MKRAVTKKDPPSAASIDDTPTISLNAQQLEILSIREKRKTDNQDEVQRPLITRSNRQRMGMDPSNNPDYTTKESRSLFSGNYVRPRHSLLAVSHPRRAPPLDDGGLLRKVLEHANQKSRQSSRNQNSTHLSGATTDDYKRHQKHPDINNHHALINHTRVKKEPEDSSERRKDPAELNLSNSQSQKAGNESEPVGTNRAGFQNHGKHYGRRDEDPVAEEIVTEGLGQTSSVFLQEEQSEQRGEVATIRSSVRRKLEDMKRTPNSNLRQEGKAQTSKMIGGQHNASEISGQVASEKNRQLIEEKMRKKRKGIAGRPREQIQPDDEFESFSRTLQHEATMSNSQVRFKSS